MPHLQDSTTTTARQANEPLAVEMRGIVKRFGTLAANNGVDFDVRHGEIHALLGENGAGKTTLMNMLYGLITPDSGEILVNGRPVHFGSPQDAKSAGIGMVHQHDMLVPTLTVPENVILGDRDHFRLTGDYLNSVIAKLEELEDRYGLEVNKSVPVWQLSVGVQQRVEILRALYHNSQILILDEPTAMLTPIEVEQLLPRLRAMADAGTAIIIITHHLDEVMAFADRITVLRAGENVATVRREETDAHELARMMVGHEVSLDASEFAATGGSEAAAPQAVAREGNVLTVEGLCADGDHGERAVQDITFEVGAGEVVAIAGVAGNGQTELEEVLFGLRPAATGSVQIDGEEVTKAQPGDRAKRGMGYIPSNRYQYGLIRDLPVSLNLVLDRVDKPPFGRPWKLSLRAIVELATHLIDKFAIRVKSHHQLAGTLSGGNAQRVVLARVLSRDLRVLLAAQPASGLDVGAVLFVWEQIRAARENGVAVVLFSTELEEIFALADRCYVMYRGRLVGHWSRSEMTREAIGLAMGGVVDNRAAA